MIDQKTFTPGTMAFFFSLLLLLTAGAGCVSSTPRPSSSLPRGVADAHDIEGYTAAGWTLMKDGEFAPAIELLEDGIRHNPDAFQLYVVLGQVYTRRARKSDVPADTDRAFQLACDAYGTAVDLGMEERRHTLETTWSDYRGTDLRDAARMGVLLEAKYGDPGKATAIGNRYLQEVGADPVIERTLPAKTPE